MAQLASGIGKGVVLGGLLAVFVAAGSATAGDSCRQWRSEHRDWKTEAIRLYLSGAPQREVDAALFELLQREAYLTSCEVSVEGARADLVGWRLVGRLPDEYGSAVLESVLERAGFDLDLRRLFEGEESGMAAASGLDRRSPLRRGRRSGPR
jgi:hypothetical protein